MKILNFGSLNIDNVYKVDKFLLPGETKLSLDYARHSGGKGLNQSISASKAGNKVFHAAYLGNDGQFLKDTLIENGVNVDYIKQHEETSGHAVIQVDEKGQNCILLYGGTNQCLTETYIDGVLESFGNNGLVILQNETNLVGYIIAKAYEKGLQVALNAAPMDSKVLEYPLEKLTWLVVNEVEGKQIAGCEKDEDILGILINKYPKCKILLTLGANGAICYDNKKIYKIGCYDVAVVDTTAAGDTFMGYFLYGVLNEKSIEDSLILATTASAICIGRNGAANSIPLKADVDKAINEKTFGELSVTIE